MMFTVRISVVVMVMMMLLMMSMSSSTNMYPVSMMVNLPSLGPILTIHCTAASGKHWAEFKSNFLPSSHVLIDLVAFESHSIYLIMENTL